MRNVVSSLAERPVTEVREQGKRRRFSADYKQRILQEAAACTALGALGALLRREGLYSSHLTKWRQQAGRGALAGLTPKARGPKPTPRDPRDRQVATLEREAARWKFRAERAEALVELQKKVSQLLGIVLPTPEEPE
jgi:transposase